MTYLRGFEFLSCELQGASKVGTKGYLLTRVWKSPEFGAKIFTKFRPTLGPPLLGANRSLSSMWCHHPAAGGPNAPKSSEFATYRARIGLKWGDPGALPAPSCASTAGACASSASCAQHMRRKKKRRAISCLPCATFALLSTHKHIPISPLKQALQTCF